MIDVPFHHIYFYIKGFLQESQNMDITTALLEEKSDVSESTIKNYLSGKQSNGKFGVLKGKTFQKLYESLVKHFYVLSPDNYKNLSKKLIMEVTAENEYIKEHPDKISADYYLESVSQENVPNNADEFEKFLNHCLFHEFLEKYMNLWGVEEYRLLAEAKKKEAIASEINRADSLDTLMIQTLRNWDTNQIVFSTNEGSEFFDYSYFKKNKFVLITGPGGQGKTTFLKVLKASNYKMGAGIFERIIVVPLVNLNAQNYKNCSEKSNLIIDYIARNELINISKNKAKCLVLLDGYNEYRTAKNIETVNRITDHLSDLINNIENGDLKNISLVITTREADSTKQTFPEYNLFEVLTLSGTTEKEYEYIKNECEKNHIIFSDSNGKSTEISELLHIPLYALLIKNLIAKKKLSDVSNKYQLFDAVYKARSEQRIGRSASKSNYDKSTYLYFYYIVIPYIAYQLVTSNETENEYLIKKHKINVLLDELNKNTLSEMIYDYIRDNSFPYLKVEFQKIGNNKLSEFFHNEEKILIKNDTDGTGYMFEHEDWRNFLAAKFLNINIILMKKHYMDKTLCQNPMLNLNVNSSISQMIRQSVGMFGTEEENAEKLTEFFALEKRFYNNFEGTVKFLNLGYEFNDFLQLPLTLGKNKENEAIHQILVPFSDFILKNSENTKLINYIRKNSQSAYYTFNVLSKESEYYRRIKDYEKSGLLIDFCTIVGSEGDIILQQKAKLYLCYFESLVLAENIISKVSDTDEISPYEIFVKGLELLKELSDKGYFLSANTYGLLRSTPAPYLFDSIPNFQIDFCEAFLSYINVIFDTDYRGRDISYTVRQALNLLVKGYIKISEDNEYDPENEFSELSKLKTEKCGNVHNLRDDKCSREFAKQLINKCIGQDLAGLNYLRGCVELYSSNKDKAKIYFKSPLSKEATLLYDIRLKYDFENLDISTDAHYFELADRISKNQLGLIDNTHPIYWYLEAKKLELSYLEGESKIARAEFFDSLETGKNIKYLVEKISLII